MSEVNNLWATGQETIQNLNVFPVVGFSLLIDAGESKYQKP